MIAVTEQNLVLGSLPQLLSGFRIVHLTDIHRSRLTSEALLQEAVRIANALMPDIVVLTGDFVTEDVRDIAPSAALVGQLRARLGVFATLGNHDYTADGARVQLALESVGVQMLQNRNVCLEGGLWLAGLDDDRNGKPDLEAAFAGVPLGAPLIVLCHNPAFSERFSERECVVLSGHTHGGQVVVPFLTAWKVRRIGAKGYRSGWYDVGGVRLYVNRGLGNVGVPFRFLASPEVALFCLQPRE